MERMWIHRQGSHLGLGDGPTRRVGPRVQLGLDAQASRRFGVPDQLHNGLEGAEGTASPVLRDVADEAVRVDSRAR
jgi:hypothetical protein